MPARVLAGHVRRFAKCGANRKSRKQESEDFYAQSRASRNEAAIIERAKGEDFRSDDFAAQKPKLSDIKENAFARAARKRAEANSPKPSAPKARKSKPTKKAKSRICARKSKAKMCAAFHSTRKSARREIVRASFQIRRARVLAGASKSKKTTMRKARAPSFRVWNTKRNGAVFKWCAMRF